MPTDGKFRVTILNDPVSFQETVRRLKKIQRDSDATKAKVAGIGLGFRSFSKETEQAIRGIERLKASLLGIGRPGPKPFKEINRQLDIAILKATQLRSILSAPLLLPSGQGFQTAPRAWGPGFIQKQIGFERGLHVPQTPLMITDQEWRKQFTMQAAGQPSRAQFLATGEYTQKITSDLKKSLQPAIIATGNSYAAAARAAEKFYGVPVKKAKPAIKSQKDISESFRNFSVDTKQYKKDLEIFGKSFADNMVMMDRTALGQNVRNAKRWKSDIESAKNYDREVQRVTDTLDRYQAGMHKVRSAGGKFEQATEKMENRIASLRSALTQAYSEGNIKKVNKIRQETRRLGDQYKRLSQRAEAVGKKQSFINTRFGRFSIIMSGIAATLFVWQTIVRVTQAIFRVGIDIEKTYAAVANNLQLSRKEMENLGEAALRAQGQGGITADTYMTLVEGLVETGNTAEEAMDKVNQALGEQNSLIEGTLSRTLSRHAGLWRNYANQAYNRMEDVNNLLRLFNRILDESIVKYPKLGQALSEERRLRAGVIAGEIDPKLYEFVFGELPEKVKEALVTAPEAAEPRLKSVTKHVEAIANAYDETAQNAKKVVDAEKELKEIIKLRPKALQQVAGFLGEMSDALRKRRVDEINNMVKALEGLIDPDKLARFKESLLEGLKLEGLRPGLDVFKQGFEQYGIYTEAYFTSVFEAIDRKARLNAERLAGYARQQAQSLITIPQQALTPEMPGLITPGAGGLTLKAPNLEKIIQEASEKYEVSANLIKAVIAAESSGRQFEIGKYVPGKGRARGFMQIMPEHYKKFGVDEKTVMEAEKNINIGTALLREALDNWKDNLKAVIGEYHSGFKEMKKAGGDPAKAGPKTLEHNKRVLDYLDKIEKGEYELDLIIKPQIEGEAAGRGVDDSIAEFLKAAEQQARFAADQMYFKAPRDLIEKYFKDIGGQFQGVEVVAETHYKNQLALLENSLKNQKDAMKFFAQKHPELELTQTIIDELFKRIERFKKYQIEREYIQNAIVTITKDQQEALTKILMETGFLDPRLETALDIQLRQRAKHYLEQAGKIDREEGERISRIIIGKGQFETWQAQMKPLLEGWQNYYDSVGIMTEAHVNYLKTYAKRITDIFVDEGGMSRIEATKLFNKMVVKIEKDAIKGRIDAHKAYFDEAGKMTTEYYNWQIEDIKERATEIAKHVGPDAANEYMKRQQTRLDIDWLLGQDDFESGVQARMKQVTLDVKNEAQKAYQYVTEFVTGSENILEDSLFSLMQGEFESFEDIFESLGMSFQSMINKMAADILAAELGKLLFGSLAGTGGLGSLFEGGMGLVGAIAGALGGGGASTPLAMSGGLPLRGAKGLVFDKFQHGGIFYNRTRFKYAGGLGEMGEAGPEAVVPLTRLPSGRLGVETTGKAKTYNINPTIIVQAPEGRLPKESMNQISNRMGRVINNAISRNN